MLAKLTYKNQITLPKSVVKDFPDVQYFDVTERGREIVLTPVRAETPDQRLGRIRRHIKALGLTEKDIKDAVKWARKRPS